MPGTISGLETRIKRDRLRTQFGTRDVSLTEFGHRLEDSQMLVAKPGRRTVTADVLESNRLVLQDRQRERRSEKLAAGARAVEFARGRHVRGLGLKSPTSADVGSCRSWAGGQLFIRAEYP
ncbi:hypothetical protein JCM9743_08000 [Natrinema sp. JCM 9743]